MQVLITGGTGSIGTRLCEGLASGADRIVVLDNLHEQVQGTDALPPVLAGGAELVQGDVAGLHEWAGTAG
jgi:nucleoside-diphosphate-sugar epimerase